MKILRVLRIVIIKLHLNELSKRNQLICQCIFLFPAAHNFHSSASLTKAKLTQPILSSHFTPLKTYMTLVLT